MHVSFFRCVQVYVLSIVDTLIKKPAPFFLLLFFEFFLVRVNEAGTEIPGEKKVS